MSLEVDDLQVYYRTLHGDVQAVDGVTFRVADGEIMGLAGESGCGKSSLGNSLVYLTGRMKYVGGAATLDGAELPIWDFEAMNEHRYREISVIPQYAMSALNPTRKIGRMTSELLRSRGVPYKSVVDELVRRFELVGLSEDVLGMYPIELSGGMKQRTVMVISTLLDPSLLIADEITSALDVSSQKGGRRAARRVSRPRLRQEHDRHHARHLDSLPGRGHDPRHVRRAPGGEGARRRDHQLAAPPVHEAADLVVARDRRQVLREAVGGHSRHATGLARSA